MTTATTPARAYEIPENCVVIDAYPEEHRVSSDHAWLDSGSGYRVVMWDRVAGLPRTDYVSTGWGDGPFPAMPTPNATDRERLLHTIHGAARAFMKTALGTAEKAHYLQPGRRVRVTRGRKVPLGEYEVTRHDQGNYGPYVDLRDAAGTTYRYVSVENIEVIPDYAPLFATKGYQGKHADLSAMMAETAAKGFTATAWGILADWIEDKELPCKSGPAADFAQAIRAIIADADKSPRFSTYYAECHNGFRRPFSGV